MAVSHASANERERNMPRRKKVDFDAIDHKGEWGGDTGKTEVKGDGPQAEKGDWRREYRQHEGHTRHGRGRPARGYHNRSGSESNRERDE
jgi:hypothetical protein